MRASLISPAVLHHPPSHPPGIFRPGAPTSSLTTPTTTPSTTTPTTPTTPTPPKPESPSTPAFPTKGPLAAVPGQSTFDGCSPGCALCLVSNKASCLACTDVRAYSNVNGTCVCGAGRGGPECSACEVGYFSTGGSGSDPTPMCKKCRPGFSTRAAGATDVAECNGEFRQLRFCRCSSTFGSCRDQPGHSSHVLMHADACLMLQHVWHEWGGNRHDVEGYCSRCTTTTDKHIPRAVCCTMLPCVYVCVPTACDTNEGFTCLQCKRLDELAALAARQSSRSRSTSNSTSSSGTSSTGTRSTSSAPSPSPSPSPSLMMKPMGRRRRLRQAGADSSSCPVGFYSTDSGVLDPESKPAAGPGPAAPKGCSPCPEGSTTAGPGAKSAEECTGAWWTT